ncbi:hypothetical protein OG512_02920 [Streptomyces sp. NBC_01378]|jgi:hypothetical protein
MNIEHAAVHALLGEAYICCRNSWTEQSAASAVADLVGSLEDNGSNASTT